MWNKYMYMSVSLAHSVRTLWLQPYLRLRLRLWPWPRVDVAGALAVAVAVGSSGVPGPQKAADAARRHARMGKNTHGLPA